MACPFCQRARADDLLGSNLHAVAFADRFEVSNGHALVIPRRHVADPFDLASGEWMDLWLLVREIRDQLMCTFEPAGLNVGFNAGVAAGQTVDHAHVHLIPRYTGDVPDPRGGVRWVLPLRARYWDDDR